ncbi:helix-turn-helix transcriptional regulator [Fructobacillus sp. M2-14]|uniref:Helix-turn-helix transcriptional regulator n=1 Tax=Fructobacillus broussonetiae TaxID=2713173 RepID=A0ABS5R162_9LACO|nr:helix-turn-helix transcriptional regulator [Fructobacillus broussonetiae]MBS9338356.1 helix-turn-helix transcriptional regulator [Fructobacillus broussonetiae]
MSWKIKDTENWQQLLSNHGYSESSLARDVGVTYQSMWRYRKKGKSMRPENARKISNLLGGSIKDFFYQ